MTAGTIKKWYKKEGECPCYASTKGRSLISQSFVKKGSEFSVLIQDSAISVVDSARIHEPENANGQPLHLVVRQKSIYSKL